ncbi:MAG: hypothetical protein EPN91_02185 [Salinibacterium sp.]|nr:MAG: hypothetical protein EPN91_02185 [Salinibacterium sp.]
MKGDLQYYVRGRFALHDDWSVVASLLHKDDQVVLTKTKASGVAIMSQMYLPADAILEIADFIHNVQERDRLQKLIDEWSV